jgi:hypothetical protein
MSTTTINNSRKTPTFPALTFSNDLMANLNATTTAVGNLNKSIKVLQSKIVKTIDFSPVVDYINVVNTLHVHSIYLASEITKILRDINGPDVLFTLSALGKGKGKGKNKRSRNLRAKPGRNRTRRR